MTPSGDTDGTPSGSWSCGWETDHAGLIGCQQQREPYPKVECRERQLPQGTVAITSAERLDPERHGARLVGRAPGRERDRKTLAAEAEATAVRRPFSRALNILNEQEERRALALGRMCTALPEDGVRAGWGGRSWRSARGRLYQWGQMSKVSSYH